MQIMCFSGSRDRQGQTARAIAAIGKGVARAGGKFEAAFLPEYDLERCRQCESDGWGICRNEHRCIIEDDFSQLVKKVESADAVVFATPVYFLDMSESLRTFLDRLARIRFTLFNPGPPGTVAPPPPPRTPAVGVCYAGRSGMGTLSCCTNLDRILQLAGFDVVDMVPARRQNLEAKLPQMEIVGEWLVSKPTSGAPFMFPPR